MLHIGRGHTYVGRYLPSDLDILIVQVLYRLEITHNVH